MYAQTTSISGIINRYAIPVLIDRCNSSIVVKNPTGFAAGDKILIIQMKGAEINTTNTSSFGAITSLHNAGNYELATVEEVNGFTLVLQHRLVREYDLSYKPIDMCGRFQLNCIHLRVRRREIESSKSTGRYRYSMWVTGNLAPAPQ